MFNINFIKSVYLIGHVGPGRARGFGDSWKFQYQESFYTTISPVCF